MAETMFGVRHRLDRSDKVVLQSNVGTGFRVRAPTFLDS